MSKTFTMVEVETRLVPDTVDEGDFTVEFKGEDGWWESGGHICVHSLDTNGGLYRLGWDCGNRLALCKTICECRKVIARFYAREAE